nr:immunoglobulin light chain junction region [Macaca mulatta]MOW40428.1 immunoglobulin light chain junction region [Macaca mulatta]
CMQGLDFHWTF